MPSKSKKIYHKIRRILPEDYNAHLSKIVFAAKGKPYARKDNVDLSKKFPGKEKGGVIITADFELGWAVRYSKTGVDPIAYAAQERHNVPVILNYLDEYMIPITWATVGHLFLKECKKGDHDWMRRIPYFDDHWKYTEGDWFDCDPYTYWEENSAWYAPDLIEKILNAKCKQEIGCHSFSHIHCSDKICPPEVIDDELKACSDAAKNWNLKLESIAFPGGTAGNFEILKKHGYKIYRKKYSGFELAYPFKDKFGMLITVTGPLISYNYSSWSLEYNIKRYKKYIDKAIETNSVVHLWFHPAQDKNVFTDILPMILKYASEQREKGNLWVGTMRDIADHIIQNKVLD